VIWLVVALVLVVALLLADRLRPRIVEAWRRHRDHVDECETCGRALTAAGAHVLRSDATDDAALGIGEGGTFMSATYCRRHFPRR